VGTEELRSHAVPHKIIVLPKNKKYKHRARGGNSECQLESTSITRARERGFERIQKYAKLSSKSNDDNLRLAIDVAICVAKSKMKTVKTDSEVDDVLTDARKDINEMMRTFVGYDLPSQVKDELSKKTRDSQIIENGVTVSFVADIFMRGFMAMIRGIVLGKYVFC
jgi:hypothetical protein